MKKLITFIILLIAANFAIGQVPAFQNNYTKPNFVDSVQITKALSVGESITAANIGKYGELYNTTTVISTAAATYYTLTGWTAGQTNGTTLDTDSTIQVLTTGIYLINFHVAMTHAANTTTVHICAFNSDGTEYTNIETETFVRNGTETYIVSGTGLVSLTANEKVSLRMKADNTGNFTPKHSNFNILRIY